MKDNDEEVSITEWLPEFMKTAAYKYIYSASSTIIAIWIARAVAKRLGVDLQARFS